MKPGPRQRRAAATGASGFTLIEITLVLFIMGLMMMIATPYLRGFRNAKLRSEARRLSGRVAYLYDRASADKVVLRLTFDFGANRYFVSRLDPYALQPVFQLDTEPGFQPVLMPVGVRVRDVTVEGVGTLAGGTTSCFFYPEGYVDATVVHMADDWGDVFTLTVNPFSGRVAIAPGNLGPKPRMMTAQ
ncbi:MAG: prepilin-type N-terminal cleavage/methylation domain-containing protein [Candidatus Binataceae bacterium]